MRIRKKDLLLLFVIIFFLFTLAVFNYRDVVYRGEWITPGDENKDKYYNEHKTSGNPEIDAIRYNHHLKKAEYVDSTLHPTLYQLDPLPLTLPKPSEPIKQLTPEVWTAGLSRQRVDNPVTQYNVSSGPDVVQDGNKRLVRKRRKKIN